MADFIPTVTQVNDLIVEAKAQALDLQAKCEGEELDFDTLHAEVELLAEAAAELVDDRDHLAISLARLAYDKVMTSRAALGL